MDKHLYVLKVNLRIENCKLLSVAIRSTLDIFVKIPSDKLFKITSRRKGSEFFEAAAVDFISQVEKRIIWLEADCKSNTFLSLVASKLVRLKKICICSSRRKSTFTNSNLLSDLIRNSASTLEELNICTAKLDQDIKVNLPNLKILFLEKVVGEKFLLSILTSILKYSSNLESVTLWKIELQNVNYYLHNFQVTQNYRKDKLQQFQLMWNEYD